MGINCKLQERVKNLDELSSEAYKAWLTITFMIAQPDYIARKIARSCECYCDECKKLFVN